ncbi:hypothetical protein GQ457_16G017070 [Hibiscus cannabinus]
MFDIAINTTLDHKNPSRPNLIPFLGIGADFLFTRERGSTIFGFIREGVSESFCSLVYSGELRRDALPRSEFSQENLPRPDPLSLSETSPLSSSQSRLSKPLDRRSRSIDNQSRSYNSLIEA